MKYLLFATLLSQTLLNAQENPLSTLKQESLTLKRQQAESDLNTATKSWISPLMLNLSINHNHDATDNDTNVQNGSLQWNQDIFRSGGIENSIVQAKANSASTLLGIDIQEAGYYKQIFTFKTQIMRDTLKVKQNELTLKNSEIDLMMTKAKYKAGLSDLSQLNQMTLNRDTAKTNLITIKNSLKSEAFELQKLTGTHSVENIEIPEMKMPSSQEYLTLNLELQQYSKQESANEAALKVKNSSYLPKLTFNSSFGYAKNEYSSALLSNTQGNVYSYGLSLSMPLFDITKQSNIESSKLQYLQTKSAQNDRRLELQNQYDEHINNIKDFQDKIDVADEMIKMYDELYGFTKGQVGAGFKSQYDLESLANSSSIQKYEKQIQNYNIQLEKIALYFDMKH